jgi:hypothetical protein
MDYFLMGNPGGLGAPAVDHTPHRRFIGPPRTDDRRKQRARWNVALPMLR